MGFLEDLANLGKNLWNGATQTVSTLGNAYGNALGEITGVNAQMQQTRNASQADTAKTVGILQQHLKTTTDPVRRKQLQTAISNIYNTDTAAQNDYQNYLQSAQQATDPAKVLAASGSLGLDLATLGYGTGGVQAVKEAALQGGKLAGAKVLGSQMLKSGLMAAPSGALSVVQSEGNQTKLGDVAQGAGTAFALGGALPLASYGVSKGIDNFKIAQQTTNPQAGSIKIPNIGPKQPQNAALDASGQALQTPKVANTKLPVDTINTNDVPTPTKQNFAPNSLTEGAKAGRQNISQDTINQLDNAGHQVRNTQALADQATAAVDKIKSSTNLINQANERLAVRAGSINDGDVAFITKAIERLDNEGKSAAASALHDSLSEHLVANGQTSQAAIILYNRSPEGLFNKAVRDINKGNKTGYVMPPEVRQQLQVMKQAIKNAPDERSKQIAVAQMGKFVQNQLPQGAAQSALSVWKAGLLSGPITHAGNILSNATFGTLKKVSDLPATAVDMGLAKFGKTNLGQKLGLSGERTKAFTMQGAAQGASEGLQNAGLTVKTGVDLRNVINNKYEGHGELNFKNPVIQKVFGDTSNGVFRFLGASDQPFYYSAAKNSLYDQAIAAGKNQKLSGTSLQDFVKNTVANPTNKMAVQAQQDAEKAVLGESRAISNNVSQFVSKHPAIQTIVPFTKVPTNFLAQTLDYTPVGAVTNLVKQVHSLRMGQGIDQRALSEAIGKAATGTGLIYIGSELANGGLLSGQYPTDPKEQQRWKAEGIQPNSIHIGNTWYSLNYLGPVGILMQAGKDYHDAAAAGDNGAMASILGVGKSLTGQSFLTGFSGFANALNDPGRYGTKLVNQQAGSIVPNWIAQTANFTDSKQRDTNNALDTIQSRIPGARNQLNIKTDVYGNELNQRTAPSDGSWNPANQANLILNPFRPSNTITSPTLSEVNRLHNVDPNNTQLSVTPTPIGKSISVGGSKIALTDQQSYDIQKAAGQYIQNNWQKLIQTPEYQGLSNPDKAAALAKLKSDAQAVAERQFMTNNNLAQYPKAPTSSQSNLANNTTNLSNYAVTGASDNNNGAGQQVKINAKISSQSQDMLKQYNSLSTDQRKQYIDSNNGAEYQYNLAKYENDVANGSLSKAEQARAQTTLAKDKVGANFSKETRDLYGLTKDQLYNVLTSDPNGQTIAEQILSYGDALAAAGLETRNKFRDKYGNVAIAPTNGKSGSSRKKSSNTTANSAAITAAASASKAAASAKLATRGGGFQNKIAARGLQAYKKPTATKVRTA